MRSPVLLNLLCRRLAWVACVAYGLDVDLDLLRAGPGVCSVFALLDLGLLCCGHRLALFAFVRRQQRNAQKQDAGSQ